MFNTNDTVVNLIDSNWHTGVVTLRGWSIFDFYYFVLTDKGEEVIMFENEIRVIENKY